MAVIVATCGSMSALSPTRACAQDLYGFRLGRWEGAVDLGVNGDRQRTTVRGGPNTSGDRVRFDEQVTVRNSGAYYLDPRLVNFIAGVTVGLFQEEDHFDSTSAPSNGTLLGYSLDSLILQEKPYSARVFANRNENIVNLDFGGRSDTTFENRGITLSLREDSVLKDLGVPNFRSALGARQEVTDEHTKVLGQRFTQDETRTILTYEASKGFQTSDLSFLYEFDDVAERRGPLGSFQTQTAGLTYSLDFGEDLNKRWESRINYTDRTGFGGTTLVTADEDLRIDHNEAFFTDYRYLFRRSEIASGVTTTQTGIARARERVYRNLTASEQVDGTLQELPNGEHTSYATQVDLDYVRTLVWDGRAFASGGVRYQVDDNQLRRSNVDVVDESHAAPTPLGGGAGFALANPFVITSTIVVVDTRGGARIPTTLGIDYIVDQQGDLTQIIPLASSAVILSGDLLAVSYSFAVNPSIQFSTLFWHGTAGVDFRWIAVTFTHEQRNQTLLSGHDAGLLEDRRVDTARLDLRGEWDVVRAVASAEYRTQDETRLKFTSEEFGQLLSYRPFGGLTVSLTGQETFTDFTLPHRRTTTYSARGDVIWTPRAGLFVNAFAEYRVFDDTEIPSETTRNVGLRARWIVRKLEVVPDVSWTERTRGVVDNTDIRFNVRVIRRF
jgi:hypothetical protein